MKLHLDSAVGLGSVANAITAHGQGFVAVNGSNIGNPVIVLPDKLFNPWSIMAAVAPMLSVADFTVLLDLKPELVVFGSGNKFCFPAREIMTKFAQAGIGFEVMDTPAACRTYNVLVSEGRRIAAALLIG